MEPLSTAASVISIIRISCEVIKYVSADSGATKERKRLRDEVRACEFVLKHLKEDEADEFEERETWSDTIKVLEARDGPLGRLWTDVNAVKTKL